MRASIILEFVFFFFFQAEDGIRDDLVTGVQTCALPISKNVCCAVPGESPVPRNHLVQDCAQGEKITACIDFLTADLFRSHVPNCSKYNSRFCPDAQCLIDEQGFRGSINFAKPKSRILTWPSLVMKRFSGFRSR